MKLLLVHFHPGSLLLDDWSVSKVKMERKSAIVHWLEWNSVQETSVLTKIEGPFTGQHDSKRRTDLTQRTPFESEME